jgi:hypothetical protein
MKQEQTTEGHPIIENFNPVSNNTSVVFTQNCEVEVAITAVAFDVIILSKLVHAAILLTRIREVLLRISAMAQIMVNEGFRVFPSHSRQVPG